MKKLVIKTIFITVAVILALCITVMSAFCVFKPKVIAKMFDFLDNYNATQYFYQRQYEKTGDINELFVLIDNAYEEQDIVGLRNYVGALISHNDFKAYCQDQNTGLEPHDMQTEEYYASFYAELIFMTDGFIKAVQFSRTYVVRADGSVYMGYTQFNPFRTLVEKKAELSHEQKQELIDQLLNIKNKITDSAQLDYILEDIEYINKLN